jgi:type VI secretion system secreted protein VgrG
MAADHASDFHDVRLESSDFPCDDLRVRKLSGREAISHLYAFELLVVCLDPAGLPQGDVLGAEVNLVFARKAGDVRRVHGMVVALTDLFAAPSELRNYRLRIAPRAHRLTMVKTSDVFVDTPVPDLLKLKVGLVGLEEDTELRLMADYPARDFVIQYDETDLHFVSRLAEHLGMSYFFEQKDDRDILVFADNQAAFGALPGAESVPFRGRGEERDVFAIEAQRKLVPRYYAVRDYDYQNPLLDLTGTHELPSGYPGGVIEHGANHRTPEEGKRLALIRAEEQACARFVYEGKSDRSDLAAGGRFVLEGHPELDGLEMLITEIEHEATLVMGTGGGRDKTTYLNTFRAIPAAQMFRPARVTPRPRIAGFVNGVIDPWQTGGQGYAPVDEHGRYRVRFFLDTTPAGATAPSCPVRMLQNHAGEAYGTHFPLRVGAEVFIGFTQGDPDRPVIVGAAPNPIKPSPVTLANPASHKIKTVSGITFELVDEA